MTNYQIEGVTWFPRDNSRFLTWGNGINVYKVQRKVERESENNLNFSLELGQRLEGQLELCENRYSDIRCLAPSYNDNLLTAIALSNGKVAVCPFMPYNENSPEFVPRQLRQCLCLAWNEADKNLLAMGYERNRSDYGILIWDTERSTTNDMGQIGLSEAAHSLSWDKQSKCLLYAGMSHKNIKMFDLRAANVVVSTSNTRSVYGLCISPNGRFLASYVDNIVNVWDVRSIEKPIVQRQMQKNVHYLTWCPSRSSVLTTLQRESSFVHLLDLHWSSSSGDPHSTKRYAAPFLGHPKATRSVIVKNISWHPHDIERMLALSCFGTVIDFQVPQRIITTWDPTNLVWGTLRGNRLEVLNAKCGQIKDISEVMRTRAIQEYGLFPDVAGNGALAQDDELDKVWKLLSSMSKGDWLGLKAKLNMEAAINQTTSVVNLPWSELMSGSIKIYRSEQRDAAIAHCGWTFNRDKESTFVTFIENISGNGDYKRAAFIAAVHLRIRYAIEILGKGANEQLPDSNMMRMAAIALSGFSLDKNAAIWRSQCGLAHKQIDDPYLRVTFAFLAPDAENYDNVLNELQIALSDRMAFACIFLNDQKLAEFIKTTISSCMDEGDLNGLLLTGATNEGMQLLQSHLDRTDDVQTVTLIVVRCMPTDMLSDTWVQHWIACYRNLLDVWELWEARAKLDNTLGASGTGTRAPKSVFLMCSFCGKNVSSCIQEDLVRMRPNAAHVNKSSSCPNCRKPLPRCSLCLLHMGTPINSTPPKTATLWFSWCQTCRHGGHIDHLMSWFEQHSECPVTSCSCKCFAIDMITPVRKDVNAVAASQCKFKNGDDELIT